MTSQVHESPKRRRMTGQLILDAITDLHGSEQVVTREILAEVTQRTLSIIDFHVDRLMDEGKIRRVKAGVFVPMGAYRPSRAITRSILPDGTSVLEIGDRVEILSPREARMLGEIFGGAGIQYSNIQLSHEVNVANGRNELVLKEARRLIAEAEKQET